MAILFYNYLKEAGPNKKMKNQLKYAHGKWTFNFLTTMSYPLLLIKIRHIFKNCFNEFYNGRVT